MRKYQNKGFSLIEVTIVLAISVVMIGVVAGVYNQRRTVTNDDAAQQVASQIQNVRNEAQKGLGPTNNSTFASGETLFGEAIEFRNDCGSSQACLRVYKLKEGVDLQGKSNGAISVYETYDVATPQNFHFNLITTGDCTIYLSCYALPTARTSFNQLSTSPVPDLNGFATHLMVVVRNASGDMYVFNKNDDGFCVFNNTCGSLSTAQQIGPSANNKASYTPNRRGVLRLATTQLDGDVRNQNTWNNAAVKYYVNIDLSGSTVITVTRQ